MRAQSSPRNTFSNLPVTKQDRIVAAAVEEFSRQGYKKASLNTIVRQAGISKGSLYQYFHNKESLFFFIFDRFTLLVKKTVKEAAKGDDVGFFAQVRQVLLAGIDFIDDYPQYFQIYLKVLFEHDVPQREMLLSQVRLFSREYFGPLCRQGREGGMIRQDVPLDLVIFILDAAMDRFLQGYAGSFLDCGLDLSEKNRVQLLEQVDMLLKVLREGLQGQVGIKNQN